MPSALDFKSFLLKIFSLHCEQIIILTSSMVACDRYSYWKVLRSQNDDLFPVQTEDIDMKEHNKTITCDRYSGEC